MAKKDKFKQMQQGGGVGSFQETLVQAATTVAAIERQQEEESKRQHEQQAATSAPAAAPATASDDSASGKREGGSTLTVTPVAVRHPGGEWQPIEQPKFMRLPNPQIPLSEYNLVSLYCSSLANMTRQDFVELAIVEKLHSLGKLTDEEFSARQTEIRNRPPRGQRKGTKQISKQSSAQISE